MPFQCTRIEELLATQLTRPLLLLYLPLFFLGEGSLIDFMSQNMSFKAFILDESLATLITSKDV